MKVTLLMLAVAGFLGFQLHDQDANDQDAKHLGPTIVAHPTFPNRSAPIPTTPLFTPAADGDFRLSVYVEAQPSSVRGALCAMFSWTDDFVQHPQAGAVSAFLGGPAAVNSNFANGVMIAHVKANTPITLEVPTLAQVGCNIPPNYSVFVTVEELLHIPGQGDHESEAIPISSPK